MSATTRGRPELRRLATLLTLIVASVWAPAGMPALGASPATATSKVKCPIKAGSAATGPVQWAFTESAPPTGRHPGLSSAYTHGRGQWLLGHANGTVCHTDLLAGGHGSRDLVLAVAGSAKLTPHIRSLGLVGVALTLKVSVAASDDASCPLGTRGTVTLFASYYSVHRDSLRLRFAAPCAAHDHLFEGRSLHVLITRKGAQVNSA
jgi:hypothetical protein